MAGRWGRELSGELAVAERREWLLADGRGGYAMGTVAGSRTRAYHGLLVAALDPPVARRLVVAAIEADVTCGARSWPLSTNRWQSGVFAPEGWRWIESFALDETLPVWTHVLDEIVVSRTLALGPGGVLAYVVRAERAPGPVAVRLRLLVHDRDHHGGVLPDGFTTTLLDDGAAISLPACGRTLRVLAGGARCTLQGERYAGYDLAAERERGLPGGDDAWHALDVAFTLAAGAERGIVVALEGAAATGDAPAILAAARERSRAAAATQPTPERAALARAAGAFVVARGDGGRTVIAGYPWFEDWGRDTMIALPGLLLATRRFDDAREILGTFARYVDGGMIPNRFPDAGGSPEYNTVDAALWFIEAVRAYVAATGDADTLAQLWPALRAIVEGYRAGTRYGIRVDVDGLVRAGVPGVQLTWMDAKVGDDVITPRIGKPVEVNALWYAGLRAMEGFAKRLDRPGAPYRALADRAAVSFGRFWNAAHGWCFDVVDGPDGDDATLRPNQLLAVSLHAGALEPERAKAVVDTCARELWTPLGLRTLARGDTRYAGTYGGDARARDAAYHNGTVWPWLLGPFVRAHLRVYGDRAAARGYLAGALDGLERAGLGTLGEIADGDAPHAPRGCPAQAWSVGVLLETLALLDEPAN